jgi:prepilin-type N-terminal cleavage/methylation domain-containing protein
MKRTQTGRLRTSHGFSIVELATVVAIMLLLSAIALPSVIQSARTYRLNAAATNLQNIIEVARFSAIHKNTQINLRRTTLGGQQLLYVDLAGNSTYTATDPGFLLPADMEFGPAGAPAASTTLLANTQALGANGCIGFDSRGTVTYSTCGAGVPVVWFISIGLTGFNSSYRAVTVTPMAQAKAWTAPSGGNWNTM